MKKILCVLISVLMLFVLAGCTASPDELSSDNNDGKVYPVISLVCENAVVSAGDEIAVSVNIRDAKYTACFDVYVNSDEALSFISASTVPSELILAANEESEGDGKHVVIRGMVASTYDIDDRDICVITYKVADDVKPGTKLNLTVQSPAYQVGVDESGDDVYSVEDNITYCGLVIEVK